MFCPLRMGFQNMCVKTMIPSKSLLEKVDWGRSYCLIYKLSFYGEIKIITNTFTLTNMKRVTRNVLWVLISRDVYVFFIILKASLT